MATRKTKAAPPPAPEPAAKKPPTRKSKAKPLPVVEYDYKEVNPGKDAVMQMTGFEPPPVSSVVTVEIEELGLTTTSVPGVYKNRLGILVDGDGVMIDHATLKNKDQERFERIVGGPVDTPAKLLKAVALDPQMPLNTRIQAATSAAPYFDRKKPIGIDGGEDGKAITVEHIHKIQGMDKAELDQLEKLLKMGMPGLLGEEAGDGDDA